jgi:DUF4097 and DUF4098 domain-containing protein YvlB
MRKMIVPVLFVLLAAEITVAASVVMAQPGGAASLFPFGNVNFGPERRQSVPAQDLPLNGQAANITINSIGGLVEITGDPSLTAVKVEGTKIVHSFGDADFNRIAFSVAQDGANINIVAKNPNQSFSFGIGDQMDIHVTVPPALLAQLNTTVGSADINVKGLQNDKATLVLNTGSGDLNLSDLLAGKLAIKTGSGDINLKNYIGALDANTGSGDIAMDGANRLNDAYFQTGSGDIKVGFALDNSGTGTLKTGSGDVELRVNGKTDLGFDLNSGSGNINFNVPGSQVASKDKHALKTIGIPEMTIRTGSGDITVE